MKASKDKDFSRQPKQNHQPGKENKMNPRPEYIKKTYRASGKLNGRKALITGGDSGIGRAVAIHFAKEGADVAIVYLNEDQDAQETKKLVENEGRSCLLIKGDIKKQAFCKKAVLQTVQTFGVLNILVNNAAQQFPKDELTEISEKQLDITFRTNIYSYFYFAIEAIKHMKAGDTIINTSSVTAYRGSKHLLDYSATKGAITTFIRSLGTNLAEKNIRVNGVAPGPVWTPLIVSSFDRDHIKQFGKDTPMGRAGQPSEIAPAYVFLASDDASFITSQVIHINGGEVINS